MLDLASGAGLERGARGRVGGLPPRAQRAPRRGGHGERVTRRGRGGRRCGAWCSTPSCTPTTPRCRTTCARRRPRSVVRAGGVPWTVLRPAAYHQNLVARGPGRRDRRAATPLDAPFTNVDLGDVAAAAATVLHEPGHEGAVYDLAGPEQLTVREMAAQATTVLGREVTARRDRREAWDEEARQPSAGGRPSRPAGHVRRLRPEPASWAARPWLWALLGDRPTTWAGRPQGRSGHAVTPP